MDHAPLALAPASPLPMVRPGIRGTQSVTMAMRGGVIVSSIRSAARWLAAMLLVWILAAMPTAAHAEPRVALVIGNANYAANRLKNPRNDAALMARTLAASGFDVMTIMDATADDMQRAIAAFGQRLQSPETVALFYYAGHGVQANGDNYLIPLGSGVTSLDDVSRGGIALGRVFKTLEQSQSRLNIVILDACRDNPFGNANSSVPAGLAPVVAPSGTIIGYATAPGTIARDGDGDNSPYTAALAANIPAQGLTLEDVFRSARRRVRDATANRQTPWEHSSLLSEFYFHPKSADPESSAGRSTADAPADARHAEIAAWERIRASNDPEVYKGHIARFPGGLFAEVASVRLTRLATEHAASPWQTIVTGAVDPSAGIDLKAATAAFEKAVTLDAGPVSADSQTAAFKLYSEAAAAGLPPAMFAVARAHDKGLGVPKNLAEAARWYARAAERDHAPAMASLGTMREFGEGTSANLADALRLYRLAADAGDAGGLASLAYLYAQGKGVARDAKRARRLYSQSADKGHARAMFNLAVMHLRGDGGPVAVTAAVSLLQQAAAKRHARALYELAALYDEGRGVARSSRFTADYLLQAMQAAHKDGQRIEVTPGAWSYATRLEIQRRLAAKGLYTGGVHGFFNRATRSALAAAATAG